MRGGLGGGLIQRVPLKNSTVSRFYQVYMAGISEAKTGEMVLSITRLCLLEHDAKRGIHVALISFDEACFDYGYQSPPHAVYACARGFGYEVIPCQHESPVYYIPVPVST